MVRFFSRTYSSCFSFLLPPETVTICSRPPQEFIASRQPFSVETFCRQQRVTACEMELVFPPASGRSGNESISNTRDQKHVIKFLNNNLSNVIRFPFINFSTRAATPSKFTFKLWNCTEKVSSCLTCYQLL